MRQRRGKKRALTIPLTDFDEINFSQLWNTLTLSTGDLNKIGLEISEIWPGSQKSGEHINSSSAFIQQNTVYVFRQMPTGLLVARQSLQPRPMPEVGYPDWQQEHYPLYSGTCLSGHLP